MEIRITKVNSPGGWLHCMSPHSIVYNGIVFRTTEALFQYLRFDNYPDIQSEIIRQKSPMAAKMIARKHRTLLNRGDKWDQSDDDLPRMKMCMQLKLEQHTELMDLLVSTGDAEIIEDCTTHDRESARFWGAVNKNEKWIGQNILGKLWMEIRSTILPNNA